MISFSHFLQRFNDPRISDHPVHSDYPKTSTLLPECSVALVTDKMCNSSKTERDIKYEKFKIGLETRKNSFKIRGMISAPKEIISGNLCMHYGNSTQVKKNAQA